MTAIPSSFPSARGGALQEALADELMEMGASIETVATLLASDLALATRHLEALQSLDLLAQTSRACAALVRAGRDAEACEAAIMAIGLADLKQRLSGRPFEG